EDLVTKTRALDRVLLWNYYVIPMWHYNKWRMAYWKKLKRPEHLSGLDPLVVQTWWIDPASVKPDSGSK
ncbi:MAG: ABC transporter substrate-binding protein, partial [Alphaproteobacteria bacterium]|nr:ABC transporter substrate-binding protein [Alphaproteobacteria bacterium]